MGTCWFVFVYNCLTLCIGMEVCDRRWPVHVLCAQMVAALFLTVATSEKYSPPRNLDTGLRPAGREISQQGDLIGHA